VVSSSEITASVIRNRFVLIDFQGDSSVSCAIDKIINVEATIASQSLVDASVFNIKQFESIQNSQFSISSDAQRFRDTTTDCLVSVSQDTVNDRIRYAQPNLESVAVLTAIVGKQQDIDLYAFSNNIVTTNATVIRSAVVDTQSQFTTNITVVKILSFDAALVESVSVSVIGSRQRFANVPLSAITNIQIEFNAISANRIQLVSAFSTNRPYVDSDYVEDDYATNFLTVASVITNISQQLTSTFTLTADGDRAVNSAALLANSGTLTATPVVIASAISNQQSSFNVVANANYDVVASSTIQSQFTVFANAVTIRSGIFLTAFDNIQLTAVVSKKVNVSSNINVLSTIFANVTKIKENVIALSSALTFVVAIRDLRLDEIVYVIPGENYVYQIISESRLHGIYGETRIRSVLGESRNRRITGESRIHIID
jgi:hypothetical protein